MTDTDESLQENQRFIVLLRHGIAEEPSEKKADEDRSLTTEGHARMKQIARGLAEAFPKPQALIASPLLRSMQTAIWVTKGYRKRLQLETSDTLRPGRGPEEILAALGERADRNVILVGHEPHLTATMLRLTGLAPGHAFDLKKGGCYGVRMEGNTGTLEWVLTPRVLRKLAK